MKNLGDESHNSYIHILLRQTAERVQALVDTGLSPTALTMPHFLFLEHLIHAGEGLPLGRLAQALGCGRSNITQLTDRMERLGLIERQPDPSDRRSVLAVVTPEGISRYPAGAAALREVEDQLRRGLSPDGARRVVASLGDLRDVVEP